MLTRSFPFHRFFGITFIGFLLSVMVACSPTFNWRVIPNAQLGYQATFPDKPVSATRELALAGHTVPLTLQAAVVNDIYFAVGTVPLRGDWATRGDALEQSLMDALARNVGQAVPEVKQIQWLNRQAESIDLVGQLPNGKPTRALGRFFQFNGHVFEVLIIGPQEQIGELEITQFMGGFSLIGQ